MNLERVYGYTFSSIYPHYVVKVESKGRTVAELNEVLRWLTGYSEEGLQAEIEGKSTLQTFFKNAPAMNPLRSLVKGVVCGVRVEDIEEPLYRDIRYMDKLVDELAKGKSMAQILHSML